MTDILPSANSVRLPSLASFSAPMLEALTSALRINRSVLASDVQIQTVWQNLPQLLDDIPLDLRTEGIMRMCVAVATGLFDAAINYAWNAAVVELREKVRRFGIHIVPQIIDTYFDEKKLSDMQDAELLGLCLNLNLISETGYFMLDQCRDIRNNFSAAHPVVGNIDEYEFIGFLNRCSRHALSNEKNTAGVDIKEFMAAINAAEFSQEQMQIWCDRIDKTFNAQQDAIFGMLYGIYCDPAKEEHSRVTAINICRHFSSSFSPSSVSLLINRHQDYQAKGAQERFKASQAFFENLKLIGLLSESERHALVSMACKNLMTVHQGMNNFYNERPFAERVAKLAEGHQIPETVRREFVETIVTCSVGNKYGTANAADVFYEQVIKGFSPREIQTMFELLDENTVFSERVKLHSRCKTKFKQIVAILQPGSIPTSSKSVYDKWV